MFSINLAAYFPVSVGQFLSHVPMTLVDYRAIPSLPHVQPPIHQDLDVYNCYN